MVESAGECDFQWELGDGELRKALLSFSSRPFPPLPWACEHWACNDQRAGQPSISVSIVMGQLHYNVWSGTLGWSWNRLRDLIHSSSQAETETGQRNTQSSTCIILGGTKKAFLSRTVSAAQNVSFQHIIWNFINQLEFIFCKICKHKF